jgi:hypothetical protein
MYYKRSPWMSKLATLFFAGLMFAIPCIGQRDDVKVGPRDVALKTVLRQYLKEHDVESDGTVRYVVASVDLNGDGVKELIVHVMCQSLCGTGGCPTLVLAPAASSYKIVSRISITRPPIRVLNTRSHGWRDLAVWVQGGGIQPGYEANLPFDGESYATNPTVLPAHRLIPQSSGRVVISDKTVGTPLD